MSKSNGARGTATRPPQAEQLIVPRVPLRPWVRYAACASAADPEIFFASDDASRAAAKAICAGCRARRECLEYALITLENHGIWGGLDESERLALRRRRLQRLRTSSRSGQHVAPEQRHLSAQKTATAVAGHWPARKAT